MIKLAVRFMLICGLLLGVQPAQAAQQAAGPTDPAELAAFLDGVVRTQMAQKHILGAAVSVVKDGSLLYTQGYGYTDLEQQHAVDPQRTLFRPGSISKLFVWTAVMQLLEQGKLSLDVDVNQYLDYTIPATFTQPITLTNVMTHTAGFEDVGADLFKLDPASVVPLDEYLKTHLPVRVYPPGEIGAYSNYATGMAGYIVGRQAGIPFDQYVEEKILGPLDMQHSTFRQPLPAGLAPEMSGGFNYTNGGYLQGDFEYVTAYPAGSMSVTAADITHFMIAHLQNGEYNGARILQEETAKQMHQHLFSHDPRIPGMAYGFFENQINGQRVISHGGDTTLFHSGLYLLVDQNVGLFFTTNSAGGAGAADALFKAFMDRYYPAELSLAAQPPADFQQRYGELAGEYTSSRSNYSTLERLISPLIAPINVSLTQEGYLVISAGGQATQYVEKETGLFRARYNPADLVALKESENGTILLLPNYPWGFIKTPWYGTTSLHSIILFLGIFLFVGTMIGWFIQFLGGLRKKAGRSAGRTLARAAGVLFGLGFVVLLVGFITTFGNILPAYGVPAIFFQDTDSGFSVMSLLPWVLAGTWVCMVIFAVRAWAAGYWGVSGRIHYSLLVLVGAAILWMLYYWNFWL